MPCISLSFFPIQGRLDTNYFRHETLDAYLNIFQKGIYRYFPYFEKSLKQMISFLFVCFLYLEETHV